jgi:ligand-binding SRPBCC domain-containing protein
VARTIVRTSRLAAPAERVWAHATTLSTINDEMRPWLAMTAPREARGLSLATTQVPLGVTLFGSWVLLLGVVPVERMQLRIAELGPGRRFVEQSGMLAMRLWRHERSVEVDGGGCVVTDRVTVEPRLSALSPIAAAVVGRFFDHRHRRLRRRFAEPRGPAASV